jgi:hypothetical protein
MAEVTYRLFHTDASAKSGKTPELRRLTPLGFDSMRATINAACDMIKRGGVVWRIESSNGFIMERSDIENECFRRAAIES